ncbi:MAG: DEAD/DEAH box helicase [Dehalococcoidia bacterium]|nr:DEAD/DEAH box helicase [Dehalococcoidia bacterium]
MNFETFSFHPTIMAGVRALGYEEPTPIQVQSIPPIMQGRDVIGLAQTGTGKTAAFALPISHRLLQGPRGVVRAAIISPTRELAEQTNETFCELGRQTGLRSISVYGGVSMDQQIRRLRGGIEVVVACPGRLLDHLWRGTVDLSHLEVLVIDEADRMFDMGFQPAIRSILQCIMQRRQTLLFSATMPEDIRRLTKDILHDPVTVQVGRTAPAETVSHALYQVKPHLKTSLLIELLSKTKTESVLVFTRTKHRTESVALRLQKAGFRATSIQGDLSQPRRQAALDGFRAGTYKVLVATDIAARGIDISRISHVVNYDMPDDVDAYIHRIGRTGRIGNHGDALTLVTGEDTGMVRDLERVLNCKLELRTLPGFDYSQPAPEGERGRFGRPVGRPAAASPRFGGYRPIRSPLVRAGAGAR